MLLPGSGGGEALRRMLADGWETCGLIVEAWGRKRTFFPSCQGWEGMLRCSGACSDPSPGVRPMVLPLHPFGMPGVGGWGKPCRGVAVMSSVPR